MKNIYKINKATYLRKSPYLYVINHPMKKSVAVRTICISFVGANEKLMNGAFMVQPVYLWLSALLITS